jgi:hypothetical protein
MEAEFLQSVNPMGTNITNNLAALKYFYIAAA